MRFQYQYKPTVQAAPAAAPTTAAPRARPAARPTAAARALPVKRPVAKNHNRLLVRGAIASAALIAAAGCATLDPDVAKAWKIEPVFNVKHAIESSEAYYTMGRYHDGARAWDKSIEAYRKAIAADAQNIEAHNALGVALAQAGRHAEAEAALRQALAIDPSRAHLRSNLGYVLLLAGKPREAVMELKAAVKQDSGNATAKANLRDALAQSNAAQYSASAASEASAKKPEATSAFANASEALVVSQKMSIDLYGDTVSVNIPVTVSVAAPITTVEVPAPLTASISVPMPLQTAWVPAPQTIAAASPPSLEVVATAPQALRVVDQPTVTSLEERVAIVGNTAPARALPVSLPVPPMPSPGAEERASRLEVSNGNGVAGMAARVGRWLATQGVETARLTNQRPFVQQATLIQYRSGHEAAAQRVARSLPAYAKAAPAPTQGLRSDVRVVLGRDWVQTAACLERNTCQPVATSVAVAAER